MKPFQSAQQMLDAHELMFGEPGRQCSEIVLRWAQTLFAVPLDALNIRVVLAPVELGPYNRHIGYKYGLLDTGIYILGNRHIVDFDNGTLALVQPDELPFTEDFIVHELTHVRQAQLLAQNGWRKTRGDHRDPGWYAAIAEACPKYLGIEFPPSSWPTGPRTRKGTLNEVEACHWPKSFRHLTDEGDPRLPKCSGSTITPPV